MHCRACRDRHRADAQVLILVRALVGFSIGGLPVAFTLFTEFCPTAGRGAWLVFLQVQPSVYAPLYRRTNLALSILMRKSSLFMYMT